MTVRAIKATLLATLLTLTFTTCKRSTTEPPPSTIVLTLEQTDPSRVQLRILLLDSNEPREFRLLRDAQQIASGRIPGQDTLVTDTDVVQTERYTYKAYRISGNSILDSSAAVEVTLQHGWRVDTLTYPGIGQLRLWQLWGVSANELLAVGHNSDGYRTIWKWDGRRWTVFEPFPGLLYPQVSGTFGIWGTSPNSFWVVGQELFHFYDTTVHTSDSAFIGYWNGSTWIKQEVHGGRTLFYVWGSSESDIYAGGWKGSLYHFDGVSWTRISNDTTMDFGEIWGRNATEVYGIGRRVDVDVRDTTYWYLLFLQPSGYSIVDSTLETLGTTMRFGPAGIWGTGTSTYSWYRGVYKKIGNNWSLIFDIPYPLAAVRGLSDTSLYAVGTFRTAYRFDGEAWTTIEGLPYTPLSYNFSDIWLNESEIFFLADDGSRTYVYHYK